MRQPMTWAAQIILLCALSTALACASTGTADTNDDSTDNSSTDSTDGAVDNALDDGSADGTDAVDAADGDSSGEPIPVSCSGVTPIGTVSTAEADIIYSNNTAVAAATHVVGDGCVDTMDVTYKINDGCTLVLNFETSENMWKLANGSFTGDANCGQFFPEAYYNSYMLDPSASSAGIVELPAAVDDGEASETCVSPSERINIVGWAQFVSGEVSFQMKFTGLGIKGQLDSVASAGTDCPTTFDACEHGNVCGANAYGYDCGDCTNGLNCEEGYCSVKTSGCNPLGTGKDLNDKIGNATWVDETGSQVSLHDYCGETAIWFIKTTGW